MELGGLWQRQLAVLAAHPENVDALLALALVEADLENYPEALRWLRRLEPTLQAADTGPAPKLIRIETNAGHGAGKPTSKIIEERSDILAFIAHAMKLEVK